MTLELFASVVASWGLRMLALGVTGEGAFGGGAQAIEAGFQRLDERGVQIDRLRRVEYASIDGGNGGVWRRGCLGG